MIKRVGRPAAGVQSRLYRASGGLGRGKRATDHASPCHATLQRGETRPRSSSEAVISDKTTFASCKSAGFTRRLIAISQPGDRSAPSLLDRNVRNLAVRRAPGHTRQPAKVRFIRLRQRLGGSWTRSAPRRANIDQDLSSRRKYRDKTQAGTRKSSEAGLGNG